MFINHKKDIYTGEKEKNSGLGWEIQGWALAILLVYVPYYIIKGIISIFKKKDNTKNPYHKDYNNLPFDVENKTYPDRNKVNWKSNKK